jgi:quinol monooxygenase YgiN
VPSGTAQGVGNEDGGLIRLHQGYGATRERRGISLGGENRSTEGAEAVQTRGMKRLSNFVSLHPYFKVHPGKLEAFKSGFAAFVEKTASEEKNLFYEFTVNGDEVFCREGYVDAEGLLAHLENVGALLAEALKIADLIRLEVHGPAEELDKLRGPMAHLKPAWFELRSK